MERLLPLDPIPVEGILVVADLLVVKVRLIADLLTGLVFLVGGLCLTFRFNVNFLESNTSSPSPISMPSKNPSLGVRSSFGWKLVVASIGYDARFRRSRITTRSGKFPKGSSNPSNGASSSLSAVTLETLGEMIDEPGLSSPL